MMKNKLSNFLKNMLLLLLVVLLFQFSVSINHVWGEKSFPETLIARKISNNEITRQNRNFSRFDKETRSCYYEIGKKIVLKYDGMEKSFYSRAYKILDLLKTEKIQLNKEDSINYPLQKIIQEGDLITIKRVRYRNYIYNEPIPFQVKFEENSLVANGVKVVWQPGEKGNNKITILERYEDGLLVNKKIVSNKRTKEPVTEIFAYGTGVFNGKYKKKFRMCASSYTPTVEECDSDPFTTATGARVRYGIVAVDPKVIKLGSKLWVSGYGYAIAADTGGLIKNSKIDLFFWRRLPDSNWKGAYIDVYLLD